MGIRLDAGCGRAYRSLLEKYGGSHRRSEFLDEPVVAAAIARLLGGQAGTFRESISVSDTIDRVRCDVLFHSGIAEHRGGLQEAAIAFDTFAGRFSIAVFKEGAVSIWTDEHSYESLPTVLKDWLLLVANGSAHRVRPPDGITVELHPTPVGSPPTTPLAEP